MSYGITAHPLWEYPAQCRDSAVAVEGDCGRSDWELHPYFPPAEFLKRKGSDLNLISDNSYSACHVQEGLWSEEKVSHCGILLPIQ